MGLAMSGNRRETAMGLPRSKRDELIDKIAALGAGDPALSIVEAVLAGKWEKSDATLFPYWRVYDNPGDPCPTCGGSGMEPNLVVRKAKRMEGLSCDCPDCAGTGRKP